MKLAFALLFLSSVALAQTTTTTVETQTTTTTVEETPGPHHKKPKEFEEAQESGADRRGDAKYSIMPEFAPFDFILPDKLGGSLGYIESREKQIEVEYLGASVSVPWFITDIGGFSDWRVSLVERWFGHRNSFNLHYGLTYFDMDMHVGNSYLASTGAPVYSDLMRARSIGFVFGVGNRWTFKHGFTLGVDWFSWSQPVYVIDQDSSIINAIQDRGAKRTLQDAFQASLYFPRLSFVKVGLGWVF